MPYPDSHDKSQLSTPRRVLQQYRFIEPLAEPFDRGLLSASRQDRAAAGEPPYKTAIAAAKAAHRGSRVAQEANCILDVVLIAHRCGTAHWAEKNYGPSSGHEHGPATARILAEMAAAGDVA